MAINREIKIGLVIAISVLAFVFGFNFLKGKNIFGFRKTYYAVYDNVNGLTESNPVFVRGLNIGNVNKIYFHPHEANRIIVEIALKDRDLLIPKNSVATIYSSSLFGGMAIDLKYSNEKTFYQPGDTLKSDLQSGLTDEIGKQIVPVKEKAEKLLVSMDSLINNLNTVFAGKTKGNLKQSIQSLNTMTIDLAGLVKEQRQRLGEIAEHVHSITKNLKNSNKRIENILANLNQMSDSLVKANIAGTVRNANQALADVSQVMGKINRGEGSLGMLINDNKLYNNLESSSRDLDSLLTDLKAHPGRYVHFSVFGKKDRKSQSKANK